jgi:hypothetical protein
MGSGTNNRNGRDRPQIRLPKSDISEISSISSSGNGTMSDICIPSFDAKLKTSNLTKVGLQVNLLKKGDVFDVMLSGSVLGSINKQYSKMITTCINMGVKYLGEIIAKKDIIYARFTRVS